MGQRPRSKSTRTHKHTDYSAKVGVKNDDFLFDLLEKLDGNPFLLILDEVQDPHNLGACLRTADAAGVHAVVAPRDRAVSLTDTVRRIACGGAESVPYVQVTNLSRTMEALKKAGVWMVGTSDRAEQPLYDLDLGGPLGIVLGAEGKGLRRLTSEKCDFLATIPMRGKVECLNVSVAAGVCLFEALRQRTKK